MSLGRALNCRKRIKQYISDCDIGDCELLTRHDWNVLEKIHGALHPYYEAMLCNEGNHNHLGHWFVTIDFLLSKTWDACCEFEELKKKGPTLPRICLVGDGSKKCLDKVRGIL